MQKAPDRQTSPESSRAEAERQLVASAERHREVVASMQELGRPEAGQHVSVKSVARAVHLVSFALRRAAEAGVPFERLVELTGWESELVREGLERVAPEPWFLARLAPAGTDAHAIAQAAARFEVTTRLQGLARRVLADVDDDAWSPEPADLADLYDRLESTWREWRHGLGREETETGALRLGVGGRTGGRAAVGGAAARADAGGRPVATSGREAVSGCS